MALYNGLSEFSLKNLGGIIQKPVGFQVNVNFYVPSGYVKIAIEYCHLWLIYPLKMVIFHSYVSLPEGN
jgi:hypothetical protein